MSKFLTFVNFNFYRRRRKAEFVRKNHLCILYRPLRSAFQNFNRMSVKKFILFEVRRIWSGRVINFSEKVENLSFYELGWPFSFLPLFFWEKKNGEEYEL